MPDAISSDLGRLFPQARGADVVVVTVVLGRAQLAVEDVDADGDAEGLAPLLALPDDEEHKGEGEDAADEGEEEEGELVADVVAELDHVEGEGEAELLTEEVDELGDFRGLVAVAVDRVRVHRGGDDLEAEAGYPHADQRRNPDRVVLQGEAVDEEARRHQDLARPDPTQPDLRFRVAAQFAPFSPHNQVYYPSSAGFSQAASNGQRASVGQADDQRVPTKKLFEYCCHGHGGEDGGKSVHGCERLRCQHT